MKKTMIFVLAIALMTIGISQESEFNFQEKWKGIAHKTIKTQSFPVIGEGHESILSVFPFESTAGISVYDVQCFRTLQNRVYIFPDNTAGAVWNISYETSTWNDRGTGYNFFDGSSWGTPPSVRIEDVKTGFPVYAPYGVNGEIIATYHFPSGNDAFIYLFKRNNKGAGVWEEMEIESPQAGISIYAPAMITNGVDNMNIHILVSTYPEYLGMMGTLLYSRSRDGGQTWDIQHLFFEELGDEYFSSLPNESYTWAAPHGDTIAFSVGFGNENGYIMKSFDNGDSWERIDVYQNPFSPYTGGATPVFGAADCTHALAIDSEGSCHVVFGRMKYRYDDYGTIWWYPGTEGIVYWNETMDPLDTTIVSSYTLENLIEGGNLIGLTIPFQGDSSIIDLAHYYHRGMTSDPKINIDDDDNIFVIWSGVARAFDNFVYNYRHIYGTGSTDGGSTWNDIIDFNLDYYYLSKECVFPSMSPTFNMDMLNFLFQCDTEPGMFVNPPKNFQNYPTENEFILMQVSKNVLLVGVDEQYSNRLPEKLKIYPNPAYDKFTISLDGLNIEEVRIYTLTGQQVMKARTEDGTVDISHLQSGMYIVEVSIENSRIRRKLLVE